MIRVLIIICSMVLYNMTLISQNRLHGCIINSAVITDVDNYDIDWSIGSLFETFKIPLPKIHNRPIEGESIEKINISPNPFTSNINILIDNDKTYQVAIYSSLGQLIIEPKTISQDAQIPTSNLMNGIYYLHMYDQFNMFIKSMKIIKL